MNKDRALILVDDDQDYRYFFCKALEEVDPNVEVTTASNGLEAIRKIREKKYDYIVLDMNMPLMNGLAFMKTYASTFKEHPSKLIVYSTFVNLLEERELKSLGADCVFEKPSDYDNTKHMISTIMGLKTDEKQCA